MEIFLIRHTTPAVRKGQIYGRSDVPLSGAFLREKQEVLQQLQGTPDKVFSSPSARCTLLAKEIRPDFLTDERLHELNFGQWENKTWDTISRKESEYWMKDYIHRRPPGGESLHEMQVRVGDFWEGIKQSEAMKIAIVTHGGVIKIIKGLTLNLPLRTIAGLSVRFGEVHQIKL